MTTDWSPYWSAHHEHHEYEPYWCPDMNAPFPQMDPWGKPVWSPEGEMEWQCKYCATVHPPDELSCWNGVDGCGAPKTASMDTLIRAYNPYGWNNPR